MTGSLAGFGYPDNLVTKQIMATSQYKNGFKIGGTTYKVNIKSYDSQSSVTKAGTLAKQAIQQDNVDLLFASSTPETVNAVASQAETLGTPLICSNIPWESWYGNLGGNPHASQTFKPKYTIMYFLGAEHLVLCFMPMWNRIGAKYGNNHKVAAAFPNDSDGNAFRAVFPPIAKGAGYTIDLSTAVRRRADQLHVDDLARSSRQGDDFFTNVPLPPDFATMWNQSLQQGFKPKLATVAKVLLFPTDAYAMGSKVYNIATDSWWVPSLPWTPRFTGQTCQELADRVHGRRPRPAEREHLQLQPLRDRLPALTSVDNPHDHAEVAAALFKVNAPPGGGRPDRLHLHQRQDEPRARRRDHPAGRHPVAEGHEVPARGQGRRQHPAAEREDHRRPAATFTSSEATVTDRPCDRRAR